MEMNPYIAAILSLVGGGSALFTFFYYRKQERRLKNANAIETEVDALRKTVESLQQQQRFYEERLNALQALVIEKDSYITSLSTDKHTLEIKHAKNKTAINAAYSCDVRTDKAKCPVLKERMKNELEYLKRIEEMKPENKKKDV